MRFWAIEKTCTAPVFIDFLKRLIHSQEQPIFLIVDGHPAHKSKMVKKLVESVEGKLQLFLLPAYSPDLNADESVWAHVKHHTVGKKIITDPDQFRKIVHSALRSLSRKKDIIINIFKNHLCTSDLNWPYKKISSNTRLVCSIIVSICNRYIKWL